MERNERENTVVKWTIPVRWRGEKREPDNGRQDDMTGQVLGESNMVRAETGR